MYVSGRPYNVWCRELTKSIPNDKVRNFSYTGE